MLDLNVYSYSYKEGHGIKDHIMNGLFWQDIFDNFNDCLQPRHKDCTKGKEYYDNSCPEKQTAVNCSTVSTYVILALQEQDKFVIQPLKQKVDQQAQQIAALQAQVNNLISVLTSKLILP
jgi:hypothetical protein